MINTDYYLYNGDVSVSSKRYQILRSLLTDNAAECEGPQIHSIVRPTTYLHGPKLRPGDTVSPTLFKPLVPPKKELTHV